MPVVTAPQADDVQGVYTKWKFVNCYVTNPGSDYCNGEHSVIFKKPSSLTMTQDVRYKSYMVSFDAHNSSTTSAKFSLNVSTDQGATWNPVANTNGETSTTVPSNSSVTLQYTFDMSVPARYRINMTAGASTYKTYIDDFTIYYTDIIPGDVVEGDVNGDGVVTSVDVTALYNFLLNSDTSAIVNGDQDGDGVITSSDITVVYNILLNNR